MEINQHKSYHLKKHIFFYGFVTCNSDQGGRESEGRVLVGPHHPNPVTVLVTLGHWALKVTNKLQHNVLSLSLILGRPNNKQPNKNFLKV